MNKKKLTKEEKRNFISVLTITVCYFVVMLFVSVFLIARIFTVTGYDFTAVGLFVLLQHSAAFVTKIFTSLFVKKFKPIYLTRVLTVLSIVYLVLLFLYQDYLSEFYMLFGFAWGILMGLYVGSTNVMIAKLFKATGSTSVIIWRKLARGGVSILFPFTLGLLIDIGNFSMSIVVVSVFAAILVVATCFVRYPKEQSTKLQPIKYFKAMKGKGATKQSVELWFIILMSTGFTLMTHFTTMLIILSFGSNISLGALKSIVAALGMVLVFVYIKCSQKYKDRIFWLCAVVPFLVSLVLFFDIDRTLVTIFMISVVGNNVISAEEIPLRLNAAKYWGGEEFIVESNLFYDFAVFIGFVLGCSAIIIVGVIGPSTFVIASAISIVLFIYYLSAVMVYFWKRKYVLIDKT